MKHKALIMLMAILTMSLEVGATERKALSDKLKSQVLKMLQVNETLHSAFFSYDASKVGVQSKALASAIDKIKDEELTQLLKLSKDKLSNITAKMSREKNNESYDFVSKALVHIVKTYDVGKYNAYSCPMVKKVWVQNSAKQDGIQNPYAPEMPACGSKDTSF